MINETSPKISLNNNIDQDHWLHLSDELIDMYDYTRDTRNLILSDSVVCDILNELNQEHTKMQNISIAFKYLRLLKLAEFRKLVNDNKSIINIKFENTYLIHEACRLGNPEYVALLLFLGAKCSILDDNGYMAQHYAVMAKSTVIIDILALFGNNMNVKDKNGNTPLYYSLMTRDTSITKLLMTYKSNFPTNDTSTLMTNISDMFLKYIVDV